ncbi:hypothetical protein [Fuerstiella marisgermanici]|uniref:Uncharacterized protein n=1 Tax=Fuerstiella marisgermanici TaxID=1891926 RepID=A0A1P8WP64_9PLAN|nr:hypothetical protein [Fuerstiella marisgermanici]APZ95847.1 hypothetical protein Fuma_05510 [Fuerstiella marisgermanici]
MNSSTRELHEGHPRSEEIDLDTFMHYYEKFESVADLARKASLARATVKAARDTGFATMPTISAFAAAFGVSKGALLNHRPDKTHKGNYNPVMARYKNFLRRELLSNAFFSYGQANGGLFTVDFWGYIHEHHRPYINDLELSVNNQHLVFKQLCREGLLEDHDTDGDEIYTYREWTRERCAASLQLRIGVEVLVVRHAVALLRDAPEKAEDIRRKLKTIVESIAKEIAMLSSPKRFEIGLRVIDHDNKFHKAWAGVAPEHIATLAVVLPFHTQVMHRYVHMVRYAEERNIFLPDDFPHLHELAKRCYDDLEKIHQLFAAVSGPDHTDAVAALLNAVSRHPKDSYQMVKDAEGFIRAQG